MWENLFSLIIRFFPRIIIVDPNEAGCKLRWGKVIKDIGPGWYLCLPICDDVQTLDVTPQVINLPNQSVTTKDKVSVAISGVIGYRISDAQKALFTVQDFDESLQNWAMGIIATYAHNRQFSECLEMSVLEKEVIDGIRSKANGWGLKIDTFKITDMVEHRVYRIMSEDSNHVLEIGD